MEVKEFTDEERQKIMSQYAMLSYANLKKSILHDFLNNKDESVIYRRYNKQDVIRFLENPQKHEKEIRELSCFLYIVSSHYRRLVDYYPSILVYNYNVIPTKIPEKPNKKAYLRDYLHVIRECEKYQLKHEAFKGIKIAVREGVFFGLYYESDDTFYIKPVPAKFAQVSGVEDGVYTYKFDLNYFNGKKELLPMYGTAFIHAYDKYKGNKEKGIEPDKTKRWFEPKNGICLKADESDPYYSFPLTTGLLTEVFSIEDAKMLQKAKKENDNYKALAAKIAVDDDGVPLLSFSENEKWFNHMVQNIDNPGIGVFMTPFSITDYSFASTASSDTDDILDAQENFWMSSGINALLFGDAKANSSSSILLSVKPDEEITYSILLQFQRFINKKLKKMNLEYEFKIEFIKQSIFNQEECVNRLSKAASLGVPVKTSYAAALGLTPSDIYNMTILEEDILGLAEERWRTPLVSSSTVSHSEGESGRPTAEESGKQIGDSGEQSRNIDANDNR